MRPNLGVLELTVAAGDTEAHPRVVRIHGETRLVQSEKHTDAAQLMLAWHVIAVMRSVPLLALTILQANSRSGGSAIQAG